MKGNLTYREIEKPAGPADVSPVCATEIDQYRQGTYQSYEAFLRALLQELDEERSTHWQRDYSSVEAYLESIEPLRDRLKSMLGFWTEPSDRMQVSRIAPEVLLEEKDFRIERFWFEIYPGLRTYALELIPKTSGPHPGLLAQHGYGGSPELVCGLTPGANALDSSYRSLGLRAVRRGFHVIAVHHPSGYGTMDEVVISIPEYSDRLNYGKNRLHRLAIMSGGTLFGLDMMASSRGLDLLLENDNVAGDKIGFYGLSQGGQSALFLPALDTRIKASVSSAYFNHRLPKLIGPNRATTYVDSTEEDKFFADVMRLFSDADIVSLIAPRAFAVEAGLHDSCVDFEKSVEEFERAQSHYQNLKFSNRIEFIPHAEGHVSATRRAFEFLEDMLEI